MESIEIGTSGITASRIALSTRTIGGWKWGGDTADLMHSIATIGSAIERGITLLDTARVPGQIKVKQVRALSLKINPLTRGIGCYKDAQWILRRWGIKGKLDRFTVSLPGCTGEDRDPLFGIDRFGSRRLQHRNNVAAGVFVFSKDQQSGV